MGTWRPGREDVPKGTKRGSKAERAGGDPATWAWSQVSLLSYVSLHSGLRVAQALSHHLFLQDFPVPPTWQNPQGHKNPFSCPCLDLPYRHPGSSPKRCRGLGRRGSTGGNSWPGAGFSWEATEAGRVMEEMMEHGKEKCMSVLGWL